MFTSIEVSYFLSRLELHKANRAGAICLFDFLGLDLASFDLLKFVPSETLLLELLRVEVAFIH